MNVLEINQLTKKFGDYTAVDHLSLSVQEGEIFGFLGPNGAGKSTTIHIAASLLSATKGEISIMGRNIAKHGRFAKGAIGFVPQDLAIYENMTAYENVHFFAGLYGLRGAELKRSVMEALEFVGLSDRQGGFPKNFSGGMKRRLNIACAIAHKPKLIIMDEPTVGIDPQSRSYILNSVKKLNRMGSTIIYTSHYMEEVEEICSRIAIIDHGKIIAEGTKAELKAIITNQKSISIAFRSTEGVPIDQLKSIVGVNAVEAAEQSINISSAVEINNLNRIIQLLVASGAEIRGVEAKEPSLETVFLTLTGRTLRDE
ncbi:ABC transporter ATP-binding protein [Paenibacillus harenae]|uniref:ABC-2 type transport system ATP-binding protein n=1 Tax=Paenibacillus harenae TaxID=306543 RepID=A0ABT9U4F4_PAEHA|nr:ABC transporter ATP-binding protein [Paenibacillus harenae]MDQ0114508.1 ABC-2 type transport system ATP-binding protein [Paenibacillus harenae]